MEKKGIYTTPLRVWKVIEESASPEKHSIIRSLIGISKLEYAADLRIELETLIEIWNDLNSEVIPARYRPHTHLGLPEPPKQREMLVSEIHLLIEEILHFLNSYNTKDQLTIILSQNLKDKENGGLGFIPNDCSEDVINYTNHIIDQRTPTPTSPYLRGIGTPNSILNDGEIVDVAKNIPVLDNETPIQVLQNALQCECDLLADDIEYIRRCVEEGHCDFEEILEPSLLDLKNERKKLEKHLIQSIEINPAINPSSRNTTKKTIPVIKSSTPVPKRKNLPPLRPTSAMQYSTANKEGTIRYEKTQTPETVQPELSLLGSRSHTDPSGNSIIKTTKELQRRKSTSALPISKTSSDYETIDDRSSPFGHTAAPNRKHCGIFCGTPDSGVSSRPVSGLGITDSTIADNMSKTVGGFSEFKVSSDGFTPEQHILGKNPTGVYYSEIASYHNSVSSYSIKTPQPPIRPRPPMHGKRPIRSARFHKIKASGNGDL